MHLFFNQQISLQYRIPNALEQYSPPFRNRPKNKSGVTGAMPSGSPESKLAERCEAVQENPRAAILGLGLARFIQCWGGDTMKGRKQERKGVKYRFGIVLGDVLWLHLRR